MTMDISGNLPNVQYPASSIKPKTEISFDAREVAEIKNAVNINDVELVFDLFQGVAQSIIDKK